MPYDAEYPPECECYRREPMRWPSHRSFRFFHRSQTDLTATHRQPSGHSSCLSIRNDSSINTAFTNPYAARGTTLSDMYR